MSQVNRQLEQFAHPWLKTFLIHDPSTVLSRVRCPVLALNGEKDLQVPCKVNLDAIQKALQEANNPNFTIKAFPNLNHLFQTCTTGSVSEYSKIEETINPDVLNTISEWVLEQK
jgi:hypothetical protein